MHQLPNPRACLISLQVNIFQCLSKPHCFLLCAVRSAKTVREERYAQQDSKRRKMREDLEKRERTVVRERSEEEKAKARLKVSCAA